MNVFLDRISAVLESPVTEETKFREVDGWSSLMVFALLVTLENDYGKRIDIAELSKYETVGDLAHLALSA
jgi:acyl carrier protein